MRILTGRSRSALVALCGLLALAVSATVWGITNLGASSPSGIPTPSPDKIAQIRDILFQDEAVKGILAGRNEGRDYWIRVDMMYERENVERKGDPNIAQVLMWFDPPVSWEGEIPTISDPCDSYKDEEGYLADKNHPCIREPLQYSTAHEKFEDTGGITAAIDLRLGRVTLVVSQGGSPDAIRQAKKLYATPGSPEQDAKVRDILFRQDNVETATADRQEGRDYWVRIFGYVYAPGEPLSSDERTVAMVDVYFDPPVSWPVGDENGLPPRQVPGVSADVDIASGEVLYLRFASPTQADIDDAKERYAR